MRLAQIPCVSVRVKEREREKDTSYYFRIFSSGQTKFI